MSNPGRRRPYVVTTNHFQVTRLPSDSFQQYAAIAYKDPRPGSKPIRKELAREVVMRLQASEVRIFTPRAIFDGMAIMFSTKKDIGATSFEVVLNRTTFVVAITPTKIIHSSDIRGILARRTPGQPRVDHSSAITLLQQIVRQAPNISYHSLKRNGYYSADGARSLGGGLQAWKGFFQSVRPAIGKLYINVDVSNVVVYQAGPLINLAVDFLFGPRGSPRHLPDTAEHPNFTQLSRFLKGLFIERPLPGSPGNWTHGKKITGLVERAGLQEFTDKDGVNWTVEKYFRAKYNFHIKEPHQFGVRIGLGAIFPAELCIVKAGQLYKKRLNEDQQRSFIQAATQRPFDRLGSIVGAVSGGATRGNAIGVGAMFVPGQTLFSNPDQRPIFNYGGADFLGEMAVSPAPEQLEGTLLPDAKLAFGHNQTITVNYGRWNVTNSKYAVPSTIHAFSVITFLPGPTAIRDAGAFVQKLYQVMLHRGVVFDTFRPEHVMIKQIDPQALIRGLADFMSSSPGRPDFILVVLPVNGAILKRQIKFWANAQQGVTTQCVRENKYHGQNANDQYCNNVALKINAKTGGVNSKVTRETMDFKGMHTMVVGCDVTHPGPGAHKPSIASLVASVDQEVTKFTSYLDVQKPRQEIIEGLGKMFNNALIDHTSFYNMEYGRDPSKWKRFPLQHVIVFRDGVSEGEYEQLKAEMDQITAFKGYPGKMPALTYIVVTKRHHVRFFITPSQASDRNLKDNCPAGLVIDNGIVADEYPNFYLQSHSGLQGTSCPSHYVVVRNDPNLSMDVLQRISYSLCFNYASATRSVSIPSPVYYADRVCSSANWLFSSDVDLESETGTVSANDREFDVGPWRAALKAAITNKRLYFL